MHQHEQISPWQATAYIVNLILPTAILFVPSITAQSAGPDSWAALLFALAFGFLVAFISSSLASYFPNETVVQYSPRILGTFWGKTVGFIYTFYFYYVAYYVQRQFAELMGSAYIVTTPLWLLIVVITLIACYALYLGLEPLARTNSLVMILLLVSISIIFLSTAKNIDLDNFTPVLSKPIGKIVYGALAPGAWCGECAVIVMLMPFLSAKEKAFRATVYALIIVFFSIIMVTIGAIGIFGSEVVSRMVFPTFSLAQTTEVETFIALERIDVLFMTVWVAGMTFKLITFFYAGTLAFSQLFNLPSYRTLIFPGAVLLVALSLLSYEDISALLHFSEMVFPMSITFVNFFLTALLLVLVKIIKPVRKQGLKND